MGTMAVLHESEIAEYLGRLEGWQHHNTEIVRQFEFKDFAEAMVFVNSVAELAERVGHHPDIAITWNKVLLTLATHSEGGITEKDIDLAGRIDELT